MKRVKNLLVVVVLLGINAVCFGQNSEERNVDSFDKIWVFGKIDVELLAGPTEKVKIEMKGADLNDITIEVNAKTLKIKMKPDIYKDSKIKVFVSYKVLREIIASTAGNIEGKSLLKGDKILVRANNGGNINVEVDVNTIELKAVTGSTIKIKGKAFTQETTANSGGRIFAFNLQSEEAFVNANTGGIVELSVIKTIKAVAGTGGEIRYKGNPEKKTTSTNLGGKIKKFN